MSRFIAGVLIDPERWQYDKKYQHELMTQYQNNPEFKYGVNTIYVESVGLPSTWFFFDRDGNFTVITGIGKKG